MNCLSSIPVFQDFPDHVLDQYSKSCTFRFYEPNELIIDYLEESRDVRFIISGRVRIILRIATGKEMILAEMKDGAFFGEQSAIDNESRSANVTAMTRSNICIMPQHIFLELLRKYPVFNEMILRLLVQRCRHLSTQLAEHCFLQTKYRLYIELLRQSKPRLEHIDQRAISPPPTQTELAARIGTRREVVSREIANLKRAKIVDKTAGALVLSDIARLNQLITKGWQEEE